MIKQELFEIGKIMPNDKELEESVIGSMLLESDCCHIGMKLLKREVFYNSVNGIIFNAIESVFTRKDPVDILTITNELKSLKKLDLIGGPYHLTTLTNRVASSANAEVHCRYLLQFYLKRRMIALGTDVIKQGYDDSSDIFDILQYFHTKMKDIESVISSDGIADNNKVIDGLLLKIDEAKNNGGIIGYSTGIKSLDFGIMGFRPGNKIVIAGESGEGKSSLAKSICINLALKQNVPGVFLSMEMTADQLMMVCASEILSIDNRKIQSGNLTRLDKQRILDLKQTLFAKNFLIIDKAGLDIFEIESILRKLVESHGIKWFVLDYLQLMRLKGDHHKNKTTEEQISIITSALKVICKDLNLAGIELSQFNNEVTKREGNRPRISDLKGSGAIRANADVVLLVYRPEAHGVKEAGGKSSKGFAEFILAKNRYGEVKNLAALYKAEFTQFLEHPDALELEISEETPF